MATTITFTRGALAIGVACAATFADACGSYETGTEVLIFTEFDGVLADGVEAVTFPQFEMELVACGMAERGGLRVHPTRAFAHGGGAILKAFGVGSSLLPGRAWSDAFITALRPPPARYCHLRAAPPRGLSGATCVALVGEPSECGPMPERLVPLAPPIDINEGARLARVTLHYRSARTASLVSFGEDWMATTTTAP